MDFNPVTAAAATISIITAFLSYRSSGLSMAAIVFTLMFGTLFLVLSTKPADLMAAMTNPFVSFFAAFPLAFTYFTIQGGAFWPVAAKSLGAGFLGGAISMTVFNYWNIGG
jgi:hypothetical protein